MFKLLRSPSHSTIPFLTLSAFLFWFVVTRLYVHFFPSYYFLFNDAHVHHFAYGIIMLSILAYVFLAFPLSHSARLRGATLLGIALSWAYDEFAMWMTLEDAYYSRSNYDAILIITLILLNLIYFPGFWARWGKRLGKLINILLLGIPRLLLPTSGE